MDLVQCVVHLDTTENPRVGPASGGIPRHQ